MAHRLTYWEDKNKAFIGKKIRIYFSMKARNIAQKMNLKKVTKALIGQRSDLVG